MLNQNLFCTRNCCIDYSKKEKQNKKEETKKDIKEKKEDKVEEEKIDENLEEKIDEIIKYREKYNTCCFDEIGFNTDVFDYDTNTGYCEY